jgi:hypothetical protein
MPVAWINHTRIFLKCHYTYGENDEEAHWTQKNYLHEKLWDFDKDDYVSFEICLQISSGPLNFLEYFLHTFSISK